MNKQLELCDFELSKLLKDVGFDWLVPSAYIGKELCVYKVDESNTDHSGYDCFIELDEFNDNWNKDKWLFTKDFKGGFGFKLNNKEWFEAYSAPTLELAKQWFREVHNIHIIVWYNSLCKSWRIDSITDIKTDIDYEVTNDSFKTYEQSLSEGLKEACKLIKNE